MNGRPFVSLIGLADGAGFGRGSCLFQKFPQQFGLSPGAACNRERFCGVGLLAKLQCLRPSDQTTRSTAMILPVILMGTQLAIAVQNSVPNLDVGPSCRAA